MSEQVKEVDEEQVIDSLENAIKIHNELKIRVESLSKIKMDAQNKILEILIDDLKKKKSEKWKSDKYQVAWTTKKKKEYWLHDKLKELLGARKYDACHVSKLTLTFKNEKALNEVKKMLGDYKDVILNAEQDIKIFDQDMLEVYLDDNVITKDQLDSCKSVEYGNPYLTSIKEFEEHVVTEDNQYVLY